MTLDIFKLLDYGFTIFFSVMMILLLWSVGKQVPKLVVVWRDFTNAIQKNTEITESYYEKSISFIDELKELKRRLIEHDSNALEVKENQEEILTILKDMESALKKKKIIE